MISIPSIHTSHPSPHAPRLGLSQLSSTNRTSCCSIDPDRPQRVEVHVLHVVGRRLQDHLVLVVLLEAVRVLGVAAVVRPDGRLDVGAPPRLRAEHAKQGGRIRRARADLGVVRLDDDAPLLLPEGLKGRDHPLEGRRHRRRKLSAAADPDGAQACNVRRRKPPWYS